MLLTGMACGPSKSPPSFASVSSYDSGAEFPDGSTQPVARRATRKPPFLLPGQRTQDTGCRVGAYSCTRLRVSWFFTDGWDSKSHCHGGCGGTSEELPGLVL